jgi:excinuclease ABC subunit C
MSDTPENSVLASPPSPDDDGPPETLDLGAPRTGSFRPDEIQQIPRAPGVYQMFDARGKIVYVGKAINLRARVRQYFAESGGDERISVPLIRTATHHIETIVTGGEKEAFLLENTLIKRHRPRYNVRLRDDKTYVSVRIDPHEEWPRPTVVRRRPPGDRALYFGPYTNAAAIRQTLRFLQKVFPLRSCADHVLRNRTRPCVLHQVGRCLGVCIGRASREEYDAYVRDTILFLKGHTRELVESLRAQMLEASGRMEYERARVLRDRVAALEQSSERQHVVSSDTVDRDVVGYAEEQGRAAIVLLFFREGHLVETLDWTLAVYGQTPGQTLESFLGQYYGEGRLMPREVLLPEAADDQAMIAEWLSELRGGPVDLAVPQRGEKVRLVELAQANAREILARALVGHAQAEVLLADLARRLHLSAPPRVIECYDIATLQGTLSAGSRVMFQDGDPYKAGYRLYRIRTVEGQDDFAMMKEVLTRRFRGVAQGQGDPAPDLVLVDGGKGQLAFALAALAEAGLPDQPVAALAKERREEGRERVPERLFLPGRKNPVVFPPRAPSFYLLQRLRDEAHRFVNTYHARLRSKANLRSSLEEIPGIGKGRTRALLKHFGSLARIRAATLEELAAAPGLPRPVAEQLHSYLHAPAAGPGDVPAGSAIPDASQSDIGEKIALSDSVDADSEEGPDELTLEDLDDEEPDEGTKEQEP